MHTLITLLTDAALLIGVFVSVIIATFHGELCGIEPGRDKSGLGGFAFGYLLMSIRWPLVAIGLLVGHGHDAIPLVAADWPWWSLLLGHGALGALAAFAFGRGVDHVHADRRLPAPVGAFLGVLLPLPALWAAIVGTNASWLGGPIAPAVVAMLLLAVHGLPFRARLRDMRRMAARLAQAAPAAAGPPGDTPHGT